MDLAEAGLENEFGHKQIELLHDRRSKIEVKFFAPANANFGRAGPQTTNLKPLANGTTDVVTKDEWINCVTVNELMMALDNLVACWACFWEGDRSLVTLRRVVTKMKEFGMIANPKDRLRLLEQFINKCLEINARKAVQKEIPLTYKEMHDIAKDYVENVNDYVRVFSRLAFFFFF